MKRLLAFLLFLLVCISPLAACTPTPDPDPNPDPVPPKDPWSEYTCISISRALELCGTESGYISEERYYIIGEIVEITNAQYGAMVITDGNASIPVYGTYSADGSTSYSDMAEKPYKGDTVLLHCILQNYNGTREIQNARLIDFRRAEPETDSEAVAMTIAAAREAAQGARVQVSGVVAAITYANGQIPSGVILVDETSSIYVFVRDLAQRVAKGDKLTVSGAKTWWVLDSEQSAAETFGYKGCCQLENATLISQDNSQKYDFDKSWIQETTVKAIMENPKENDITTLIHKVNAVIHKVDGKGFINYYIDDLDDATGSYVYTQCNGSDFAWLDAFDGKICTVYLVALNAKSSSSECFYRFLPVAVEDNGYTFDATKAPQFSIEYYAQGQFAPLYTADPQKELVTEAENALLGFSGVHFTYTSSDSSVLSFDEENGALVMHARKNGEVTVTITATHAGNSATASVAVKVQLDEEQYDYVGIGEAIDAAEGEIVTVRGIVGPSVVNQDGAFYLITDEGVLAIKMTTTEIAKLAIGNDVIIQGTRDHWGKNGADSQICLTSCTIVANYYGSHEYSTKSFTEISFIDFYNLDEKDLTQATKGYFVTAEVELIETGYYTSIKLKSSTTDKTITLYCSGAGQYSFLFDLAGKGEFVFELVPCNWNSKSFYAACAIAVYTPDGKLLNTLNFGG